MDPSPSERCSGRVLPLLVILILFLTAGCGTRNPAVPGPAGAENFAEPVHEVRNVEYVDSVGANFLFRGAHPVTEQDGIPLEFDDNALRAAIRNASRNAGKNLPASYTLVDISLLRVDNPEENNRERAIAVAEYAFFSSRPDTGRLHLWPTHGSGLDPADPAAGPHREFLAARLDEWLTDPLVTRVETVRKYLEDPGAAGMTGPVVVYVHCYGGCDRTGELIGAYSLRYLNRSWEEMRDANSRHCRPDRGYAEENCNALRWYGIWLNRSGHPVQWDTEPPCFRPVR